MSARCATAQARLTSRSMVLRSSSTMAKLAAEIFACLPASPPRVIYNSLVTLSLSSACTAPNTAC